MNRDDAIRQQIGVKSHQNQKFRAQKNNKNNIFPHEIFYYFFRFDYHISLFQQFEKIIWSSLGNILGHINRLKRKNPQNCHIKPHDSKKSETPFFIIFQNEIFVSIFRFDFHIGMFQQFGKVLWSNLGSILDHISRLKRNIPHNCHIKAHPSPKI